MPITLVTGPANAGKAEVVMDTVRRHLAHGREPLLIVPRSTDVEHYLRELAGARVAMGVRVSRFSELIDETVRRAGVAEAVLGGLARERVIATLAARRAGVAVGAGVGSGVGSGLVRSLGELFEELQVRRVSPARLSSALRAGLGAEADALGVDLIGIYADYHATLARLDRHDAEQRALRALDGLRERPSLWGSTPVLIYGFDDLTRLQLDAIETLGRVVDVEVTVSLAYEPGRAAFAGRASTFQALAPLAAEHRVLAPRADYYAEGSRAALSHLERSLFEPAARRVDPAHAVELLQGGGERAELELIAQRVAELLERGMPAHEIAVIVRRPELSAGLLAEVFGAASIPFAMPIRRPFGDSAVGRALTGLLRCVPGSDGAPAGTPADLFAWLRAPGQLKHPELVDSLELKVRLGGLDAAQARARWEQRHWRLEAIDHLADAQRRGPRALIERAARELEWIFSAPRRGRASVLGAGEMDEAQGARGRPPRARRAARAEPYRCRGRPRERRRAGAGAPRRRGLRRRSSRPGRGSGARSAVAARQARAGAVRLRPAGGRVPGARASAAAARPSSSGRASPSPPVCAWVSPKTSWQLSATCSTPCSRARRSASP